MSVPERFEHHRRRSAVPPVLDRPGATVAALVGMLLAFGTALFGTAQPAFGTAQPAFGTAQQPAPPAETATGGERPRLEEVEAPDWNLPGRDQVERRPPLLDGPALDPQAGGAGADSATSPPEGGTVPAPPLVSAIEVASDAEIDRQRLEALLLIEVGRPLTGERIHRSLTNIHAAGLGSEAEVLSRPDGAGGLVVTVVIWGRAVARQVEVEGDLGLDEEIVEEALEQREGQRLVTGRVMRGVYALQDLYRERGYLAARVRPKVDYLDPEELAARVVYLIQAGERTRIAGIEFDGELTPFTPQQLRQSLDLEPGDGYRRSEVEADVDRLRRWLQDQGYRAARVGEPEELYDKAINTMRLIYPVAVGPRVEVEVVGAELSKLRRRELLPFLGRSGYDEALLFQAQDRIERYYQEEGHYQAAVAVGSERLGDVLRVRIEVKPGPEYEIEEVRFEGNDSFTADELRKWMTTTEKRLLSPDSGDLVTGVLAADISNLRAFYALQGFTQVRIDDPEVVIEGEAIEVIVTIEEGPRKRVAELRFDGVEQLSADDLRRGLVASKLLSEGGPFHPVLLEDTVDSVRASYRAQGFDSAQVSATTTWNDANTRVVVTLRVLEGPQTVADRILVRGMVETKETVVRRALGIESGQPVSGVVLLEAQRRLYQLGVFARIEVRLAPASLGSLTRDVVVEVVEGENRRLTYGVGYDTEDGARGLLGWSNANTLGRAFALRADLRLSQRDKRFRLALDQPSTGGEEVQVTYTLFWLDEREESFDVERWGGRAEAYKIFERDRLGLAFDYRIVEPTVRLASGTGGGGMGGGGMGGAGMGGDDPTMPDPDRELGREDARVRISSLIPSYLLDRRDDPVTPTRGWSSFFQAQYAFPFLETQEEFLKLFTQHTGYLDLGRFGVLGTSVRLGGIEPFATALEGSILPPELPGSRISIAERLFAGGANTHRAFERDKLGILGQTLLPSDDGPVAVGGNGLALFNLDYRFPVAGPVEGVIFYDSGNVWADWRDIELDDFRHGAGLGVRYLSPIGPIRLEVGWKLDRLDGEDGYAIFLGVGNPF